MAKSTKKIELCDAFYTAFQKDEIVTIFANGVHNTSGYTVFFEKSLLSIFPPQFSFKHIKPEGLVLQVFTPFTCYTSFISKKKINSVIVTDADGKHEVAIENTSPLKLH